jgi:hypothetical protein
LLVAQQSQDPSSPQGPDNVQPTQLVAWSEMQRPQPVPEPVPPSDPAVPQPGPQQAPPSAAPKDQQQISSQTFTGKIVKAGDKYVLKTAGGDTYPLDQQDTARQYENKDVKVTGSLDSGTNTIRVASINPVS